MTRHQFYEWAIDLVSGHENINNFQLQKLRFMVDHIEFIYKKNDRVAIFKRILNYSFDEQPSEAIQWDELKREILDWIEGNRVLFWTNREI